MNDFLKTWYGLTLFIAFDIAAILLITAILYRPIFKRFWEIVVSAVCNLLLLPLFAAILIRGKLFQKRTGAPDRLIAREFYVGKKAKTIALHSFATRDSDGEALGKYGKWLERTRFYKLPRLWDVFLGRLGFTGVKPLTFADAAFIEDAEEERYSVRTGLINPLVITGDDDTDYKEMFASDVRYARKMSMTGDWKIFFTYLLKKIRGDEKNPFGKTVSKSYAQTLLDEGKITQDDFDVVAESAREEEKSLRAKYENAPAEAKETEESDGADNTDNPPEVSE